MSHSGLGVPGTQPGTLWVRWVTLAAQEFRIGVSFWSGCGCSGVGSDLAGSTHSPTVAFSSSAIFRRGVRPWEAEASVAFGEPRLLAAGIGVGLCSSVIPYVCDQLAMARVPRATFALLLALLPATATHIGVLVLRQIPGLVELVGVALVVSGVALHRMP